MIILGGCAKIDERTSQPNQEPSPTESAINITPTRQATTTPTHMPTSTSTRTPTLTSSPTSTVPFIPTLPKGDARLLLLDLLSANGECHLPCLWGIYQDKTTFVEAQQILEPLSSISDFTDFIPRQGVINPFFYESDTIIRTSVDYFLNEDVDTVNNISFIAGAFREVPETTNPDRTYPVSVYNSTYFGKKLAFYMLPNILSEYGRPSSVLLKTNPGPNEFGEMGLFYLILMYPDRGFLVQYTTVMRMSGTNVLGCTANAHVRLDLYPSEHSGTFYKLIEPRWNDINSVYKPLEEVTSMSLDQFYQTFRQPTDQCLVTASSHWPEPNQ
jgi:predicted transcriptional regulator with HTH domain